MLHTYFQKTTQLKSINAMSNEYTTSEVVVIKKFMALENEQKNLYVEKIERKLSFRIVELILPLIDLLVAFTVTKYDKA